MSENCPNYIYDSTNDKKYCLWEYDPAPDFLEDQEYCSGGTLEANEQKYCMNSQFENDRRELSELLNLDTKKSWQELYKHVVSNKINIDTIPKYLKDYLHDIENNNTRSSTTSALWLPSNATWRDIMETIYDLDEVK